MRFTLSLFALLFAILVLSNSSCKKNKPAPINTTCGCDAIKTEYTVIDLPGTLIYHSHSKQWRLNYLDQLFYYIYFPCNTNQDSLKAILQNANTSSTFQVKFSGKVKLVCPDEDLGYFVGNSAVYKIIIDSLKRN